ncbi:hypothetical protein H0H81_000324 [Sphagnurus paluster]|uniref:Uncharacterized protein n=1 Tax=Sphagnurus paluster TaxID=117069 RepID=A0A9P7K4J7_9AGAR|nr:hypothetical protein H0H81_000324 [Sphagnurus paluster]
MALAKPSIDVELWDDLPIQVRFFPVEHCLDLARLADLPDDVLAEGKRVAETLTALDAKHEEESESSRAAIRRKALLRLRTQLNQALDHSALPDQELRDYLRRFQDDIAKAFLHAN